MCSVIRGGGGRPDSDAKTRSKRVACAWLYLATTGTRVLLPHDIVRDALVDSTQFAYSAMSQRTMLSQSTRWLHGQITPAARWLTSSLPVASKQL